MTKNGWKNQKKKGLKTKIIGRVEKVGLKSQKIVHDKKIGSKG